jgi:hypothetical protein
LVGAFLAGQAQILAMSTPRGAEVSVPFSC